MKLHRSSRFCIVCALGSRTGQFRYRHDPHTHDDTRGCAHAAGHSQPQKTLFSAYPRCDCVEALRFRMAGQRDRVRFARSPPHEAACANQIAGAVQDSAGCPVCRSDITMAQPTFNHSSHRLASITYGLRRHVGAGINHVAPTYMILFFLTYVRSLATSASTLLLTDQLLLSTGVRLSSHKPPFISPHMHGI